MCVCVSLCVCACHSVCVCVSLCVCVCVCVCVSLLVVSTSGAKRSACLVFSESKGLLFVSILVLIFMVTVDQTVLRSSSIVYPYKKSCARRRVSFRSGMDWWFLWG